MHLFTDQTYGKPNVWVYP